MLMPTLSNGLVINADSDDGSITTTIYNTDKFEAEQFLVSVGTYGEGIPQFRYFYPKSDGSYKVDKVIWENAPTDIAYGDIFVADNELSLTKVQPVPHDPVNAFVYYYTINEGTMLSKLGNCSDMMEKKDLTVTSISYDGSSHWSIKYTNDDVEYYYGLSTYGSELTVDPLECEVGDVYTCALYNGNIVIPLSKKNSEENQTMTVKVVEITGDNLLVKPTESSEDLIYLSKKYLDSSIQPTVGMILEVIYSGGILETYPAQFGNVKKVSVISNSNEMTGDVNSDGEFSVADVVKLQKWLLAVPDTYLANWKAADYCDDDCLNVFDLCLMKSALIKK